MAQALLGGFGGERAPPRVGQRSAPRSLHPNRYRRRSMKSRGLLIALVAAALALAGCGSSPTAQAPGSSGDSTAGPFAKYANLSGADRTQIGRASCREEGKTRGSADSLK